MPADPKRLRRVKDAKAMRAYHRRQRGCEIGGPSCIGWPLSVHHVLPRSQGGDDIFDNFVMLCGSGTTGEHGLIENGNALARALLADYLIECRPDTIEYLDARLAPETGLHYIERTYG